MNLGKIILAILVLSLPPQKNAWGSSPAQASEPNQTSTPPTQAPPASNEQKQTPDEPAKPGEVASPGQHPSPLPQSGQPEVNSNSEATPGKASQENQKPPAASSKTSSKKKSTHARKAGHSKPRKRVVKEGGTDDVEVQLSERMPNEVAMHRRASTTTLLSSTEENLKRISNRQLTATQQATVDQIRLFMQQSRDAIHQSDVDRAHTLALKAHLLSDSLMKP